LSIEQEEEDYWNTSEVQSFDFGDSSKNDKILSFSSKETNELLKVVKKENAESTVPSVASTGSLTSFEELNISKEPKEFKIVSNPAQAVRELLSGEKVVLEVFTSLQAKRDLLKSAIESHDTDVIFHILHFLRKTLNEYVLRKFLAEYPSSANVYVNLLLVNGETSGAIDFLSMLAHFEDAAIIGYQDILKKKIIAEKTRLLKQLACSNNHLEISEFFSLHADLLEKQKLLRSSYLDPGSKLKCRYVDEGIPMDPIMRSRFHIPSVADLVGTPVVSTLRYLAKHDFKAINNPQTPLLKQLDVPKIIYLWSLACGRSSVGAFADVRSAVIVKSVFGPPRLVISAEPLRAMMLHFGATAEQLEQVLKVDKRDR